MIHLQRILSLCEFFNNPMKIMSNNHKIPNQSSKLHYKTPPYEKDFKTACVRKNIRLHGC